MRGHLFRIALALEISRHMGRNGFTAWRGGAPKNNKIVMNSETILKRKEDEIVVFIVRRDSKCAECGEELGSGRWLRVENDKPLCLHCADLAH